MRNCNKINYLNYCILLTPLCFLYLFLKGIFNMFYAGLLAIFWTCILNVGNGIEHGVGTLDGYASALFSVKSVSIFFKLWHHFMDKRFLWMMKLWMFHSIMLPKFITMKICKCIIGELSMMMMVALSPCNEYLNNSVHWVVMASEVMDWVFRDCLQILLNGCTLHGHCQTCDSNDGMNYKMLFFQYNRECIPLPRKLMVLSCVQLNDSFIGWLNKLGYQYGKIFKVLYRLGLEGSYMFNKMMQTSCGIYRTRSNRIMQWLFIWMSWSHLGSCLDMNCYSKGLIEDKHHNLVDFSLENVKACCDDGCSMNCLRKSIDINIDELPSCCLTALPPNLALSSTSENYKDKFTNDDSDFSLGTYEFGMDNCATHHICGDRNLFFSMNDLPGDVHVNGISGSSVAEGIGTIRFHIMDTKGHDHLIALDNVIYLPGAAKNLISISQ